MTFLNFNCAVKESSGKLLLTLTDSLYAKGLINDDLSYFSSVDLSAKGTVITLKENYLDWLYLKKLKLFGMDGVHKVANQLDNYLP